MCLSKKKTLPHGCISTINCFPLDLVQLYILSIPSFGWSETPRALLAKHRSYLTSNSLLHGSPENPLQGMPSGALSINIKDLWFAFLHPLVLDWHLILASLMGIHSLNKKKMPRRGRPVCMCVCARLIFDWAQQKTHSETFLLVRQGADGDKPGLCGVTQPGDLSFCSPVPAVCAALVSPHALWPAGSRHYQLLHSVHSGKFAAQRSSFASVTKCGILPVCLNNVMTLIGSIA